MRRGAAGQDGMARPRPRLRALARRLLSALTIPGFSLENTILQLQYNSLAKDLSLPKFEIEISRKTFSEPRLRLAAAVELGALAVDVAPLALLCDR